MAKIETVDASVPKPAKRAKRKKTFKKRGEKRVVPHGVVHIRASFNNTMITVTDAEGSVLSWSSAGAVGFKGSRKGTPFAGDSGGNQRGSGCEVIWDEVGRGAGSGPRPRPRVGHPGTPDVGWILGQVDHGRDTDPAQRVPSS